MRIARIVGARPQFMQVPPLRDTLLAAGHEHILIHTGQHYDYALSQGQLDDLNLGAPDYNLLVGSGPQGETTGRMLAALESLLDQIKPDLVVVDGDTNSTLAGALAVTKMHWPLVHVEAGLRDFDRSRPEEINRVLTDHIATLNCAPVPRALANLRNENIGARSILSGDLLLDCLCRSEARADESILCELKLQSGGYYLMTLHRPENTDFGRYDRFCYILGVVAALDKPVIWPVHPRAQPILKRYTEEAGSLGAIRPIAPVTYLKMLALVQGCGMVLTDSGGLPREAVWSGKRCVMLFSVDTWHDLLDQDWATIGKNDKASIESAIEAARPPDASAARAFFGGGKASEAIARATETRFSAA